MNFQSFLQFVPNLVEAKLPAEVAHYKMAPLERMELLKNLDINATPKVAAVMMLLYPKNGITHLVLIVRNSYKVIHSSQIAFPGGKYELEDLDYRYTALRETQEEIGVPSENIQVIRPFTPMYIPASNFQVHPFLGICTQEIIFFPDPREVAAVIEIPLSTFLDDTIIVETVLNTSYALNVKVPAFQIENKMVWGATAMILNELKEVLLASL